MQRDITLTHWDILCIKTDAQSIGVNENSDQILFGLRFYVSVNSYGQVETVCSPNHTFFLGKLEEAANQYLK